MVRLATGTFLIPRRLEGRQFQNKSKEVGRSSTRRAFGTLSTLSFLRTGKASLEAHSVFRDNRQLEKEQPAKLFLTLIRRLLASNSGIAISLCQVTWNGFWVTQHGSLTPSHFSSQDHHEPHPTVLRPHNLTPASPGCAKHTKPRGLPRLPLQTGFRCSLSLWPGLRNLGAWNGGVGAAAGAGPTWWKLSLRTA